jgi:hypothetical protein
MLINLYLNNKLLGDFYFIMNFQSQKKPAWEPLCGGGPDRHPSIQLVWIKEGSVRFRVIN